MSAGGQVQILEGVKAGEVVVTSSQFLIDSESKLREATAKMLEAGNEPTASDMNMDDLSMEDMDMNDLDMSDMTLDSPPAEPSAPERPHHD